MKKKSEALTQGFMMKFVPEEVEFQMLEDIRLFICSKTRAPAVVWAIHQAHRVLGQIRQSMRAFQSVAAGQCLGEEGNQSGVKASAPEDGAEMKQEQ